MMGPKPIPIERIEFPKEIGDLHALVELINNKAKVEDFLNKIDSHAKKANDLIEKVGKAQQIGHLWEQAKAQQEAATDLIAKAEQTSTDLIAKAQKQIDEKLEAAEADRQAAKEEKEKYLLLTKAKAAELEDRENALIKMEASNIKREESLTARERQVEKELAAIAEKKKLLASL